jgi:hypothetical protein
LTKQGEEEHHTRYSRIEHLIYAIDLNGDKTKRVMAAMATGYFDDSGSPDEGTVLVVAGYVSDFWQWLEFDREWGAALEAEGVKVFHMKDFALSYGEFKAWKDDEPRRRRFLARLSEIIRAKVQRGFAFAVLLEDYYKVDDKYMFHEVLGEPYPFCAFSCARAAEQWAHASGYARNVLCIYEDRSKHKTEFKRLMERANMIDPIFMDKDATPLQAADFLAWEHCKAYSDIAAGTFEKFRETFNLLNEIPHEGGIFTEQGLEEICREYKIPLRTPQMRICEGTVKRSRHFRRALSPEEVEARFKAR